MPTRTDAGENMFCQTLTSDVESQWATQQAEARMTDDAALVSRVKTMVGLLDSNGRTRSRAERRLPSGSRISEASASGIT